MRDAPAFQQQGVELILEDIARVARPGAHRSRSARPGRWPWPTIASPSCSGGRSPARYICAGSAPAGYLEWNVMLDVAAFVRVLRSDLTLAIYPAPPTRARSTSGPTTRSGSCPTWGSSATSPRPAAVRRLRLEPYGPDGFPPGTRAGPAGRDLDRSASARTTSGRPRSGPRSPGRLLVRRADGTHRLLPAAEVAPTDTRIPGGLRAVRADRPRRRPVSVHAHRPPHPDSIYARADPILQERAFARPCRRCIDRSGLAVPTGETACLLLIPRELDTWDGASTGRVVQR